MTASSDAEAIGNNVSNATTIKRLGPYSVFVFLSVNKQARRPCSIRLHLLQLITDWKENICAE